MSRSPAAAIKQAALDLAVDAVAMATHGRSGPARAVWGSTATTLLEQSEVPLLLLGPHALQEPLSAQIQLRGQVRTRDNRSVGEVHRVVVDLKDRAVVSIIVFRSDDVMSDLHEHLFTKDELVAEFTLTNMETGAEDVRRSNVVPVDLVP